MNYPKISKYEYYKMMYKSALVLLMIVSVPTLPPTTSTSTFTMTTEQPSTTTNQAIEITTFQQFKAESGSNSKTLAGRMYC